MLSLVKVVVFISYIMQLLRVSYSLNCRATSGRFSDKLMTEGIHFRSYVGKMYSRSICSSTIGGDNVDCSSGRSSILSTPSIQYLASESNDKVKLLKSLNLKKKRQSNNLVLLEGHRQIIDAIIDDHKPCNIFITEKAIKAPLGKRLEELLLSNKQILSTVNVVTDEIIDSISDTVNSQGVVASFTKPLSITSLSSIILKVASPLVLILDRPADPGNVGTIIRTSYGLGVDAVVIVDGCDPYSPKVLRSAMGSCLKMPIIETTWIDMPSMLIDGGFNLQILLADASGSDKTVYSSIDMTKPTAILIGSEADGVYSSAFQLKHAQCVFIPMIRPLESLNAAIAGSIILSEALRQRQS